MRLVHGPVTRKDGSGFRRPCGRQFEKGWVAVSLTRSPASDTAAPARTQAVHHSLPLDQIIDTQRFPLDDPGFQAQCRNALDREGVLSLPGLLLPETLQTLVREAEAGEAGAFFASSSHNVYLTPPDPALGEDLSLIHI